MKSWKVSSSFYLLLNYVLFDVSLLQIYHIIDSIKIIKWCFKLITHLESDFAQINRIVTGTNLAIVITIFFILCVKKVLIHALLIMLVDNFGLFYVFKLDRSRRLGLSCLLRLRHNHGFGLSYLRGLARCYWFESGLSNFSWWSDLKLSMFDLTC